MVRCTACTARATIAHATRERGHPHLSPTLSAAHSYPSSAGRSLRSLGSRTSRCLGGGEGELGGADCVPPPPFGGRGTGGGGPVVCATLSRARDPICCAHDLYAAPATFQARATRAYRTRFRAHDPSGVRDPACPAESHLSHLIPLNPGESRFEKVAGFPRASCTITCARAIGQGERTALEGFLMLPGVRCARTGPALQSSRRCGLGGPCDRSNDGTVGPRRRTVEAPWRCGSARSSRKPASCIEE